MVPFPGNSFLDFWPCILLANCGTFSSNNGIDLAFLKSLLPMRIQEKIPNQVIHGGLEDDYWSCERNKEG
jgi:hypothetical protein